jgi:hypothetical protein
MASKKYQNQTCVYCAMAVSTTADHVIARQFVREPLRANLPKVPACNGCNNRKAKLEHYLTAVLPFASRGPDASAQLDGPVRGRFARNTKLHRELMAGRQRLWTREPSGLLMTTLALPFQGEKLEEYIGLPVRGLMWHHWQVLLMPDCFVEVLSLTKHGENFFRSMSSMNGKQRLIETLADGAVTYSAVQAVDLPEISVWELTLFNGLKVSGERPGEESSRWGVITGPRRSQEAADRAVKSLAIIDAVLGYERTQARRNRPSE